MQDPDQQDMPILPPSIGGDGDGGGGDSINPGETPTEVPQQQPDEVPPEQV